MVNYTYSIQEAKKEMKESIRIYLEKDKEGKYVLPPNKQNPFFVVGEPGIGKTEMVKQIAEELKIGFFSTSVTHHTRNSVLGLPIISELQGEKVTKYTMSDILVQVEQRWIDGEREGILLIDEFASMSEALVAPMLAFLQSKCIGNHYLPDGWIMVLCSNPPEFNETAREFDAAIMDRVRIMNVTFSIEDFNQYAIGHGFHSAIIDYLSANPMNAYLCQGKQDIVTPRSWENLSNCIYGYERRGETPDVRLIYQFIKSESIANDFYKYYVLSATTLRKKDIENIVNGKGTEEYSPKIRACEYEKKWQIIKLFRDELGMMSEGISLEKKFLEYVRTWIIRWGQWEENGSPYSGQLSGRALYHLALKKMNGDFVFGQLPSELICGVLNPDMKVLEEDMLNKLLDEIQYLYGDNCEVSNDKILKIMQEWYEDKDEEIELWMQSVNRSITYTIKFIQSLDDNMLMEGFIRNLNQESDILYVLAKQDNPCYIEKMKQILGENM